MVLSRNHEIYQIISISWSFDDIESNKNKNVLNKIELNKIHEKTEMKLYWMSINKICTSDKKKFEYEINLYWIQLSLSLNISWISVCINWNSKIKVNYAKGELDYVQLRSILLRNKLKFVLYLVMKQNFFMVTIEFRKLRL